MANNTDETGCYGLMRQNGLNAAVVMATYNGARFIEEQMDSLRRQSFTPHRVIIRDDGSTDGTQEIVSDYIARYGLTNWDFKGNDSNKGFTSNFLDAALEASESIVFFCDQDDIWLEAKIEHAMSVFSEYEKCVAVLCNASIVDEYGNKADTVQTTYRRTSSRSGEISLAKQVSSMVASGHTLSVRKSFLEEVAPIIKARGLTYDSPIGIMAAARGGLFKTGTTDVLHRVHSSNTSSPKYGLLQRFRSKSKHISGRRFQLDTLRKCRDQVWAFSDAQTVKLYDEEITARERCLSAMENGHLTPLVKGLFRRSPMKNRTVEVANLAIMLFGRG